MRRVTWEYVTRVVDSPEDLDAPAPDMNPHGTVRRSALAHLGGQGWEMVGIVPTPDGARYVAFIKRPNEPGA